MTTLKNKSKSELIEEIESLKNQVRNLEGIEEERTQATNELRESEEKFRRLVENAPEIIYRFRVSPDPGFEFISPAVTEIAGYTPQEYYDDPEIGRKIIHPEDRSKLDGLYKGIIPEGPHQVRWIRKDGKIIWTEDRAIPIFNDKGEFIAIEGIAREITAQKETEEALKEAYEIINKSSAVPFLWKNEEGWPVEYVSENVAELFEYSAEEFMSGKVRYSELVHPEDTNRIENEVTKFSAEEGRDRFSHEPYRIVTKSGKIKWVEDKTYIRRDENNNLTHYQGIVEDITARKQTELARSESEEKFSKTFNSSPSPMIISEIESGKVVDINKSFEKLIMYSKQEVLGKSVFDLNLWANIEDRGYYIKKMKEDKRVSNLEIKIRTKSEEIRDALISGEIITIMDKPYLLTSGIDITERKQAEEALKEQLHLNQQILETTLDGYILADSDGKIIDVNPAYCDIIGYTWEELLEMNIREVEVKTPPEEVDQRIQQMIRTGGDHFETKHKHKDGHILELDTSTSITYLDEAPRVAAFMRDITERKQAEELIQESERRLATLMSNLPGMAYKCKNDPDWTMEFISDGCYSLTGYYTEELIDNSKVSYADLIHPEDRQMVWDKVQDGIEIKQPFQLNYRITTASGVEKWVWEQGQAIYGKENDVISLEGFITDITEQKQAENKLKESRQRLSSHMNNTPLGAIFWDVDFKVIEWNLSAEKIFGYSKEEALGKHPYKLIVPLEIQGQIDEVFKNLLTQTGGNRSVNENITKNGKRILCDWYNVAITDLAGKVIGVASLIDDITEKTLTEKKLKNSRNQLRSLAERLQMIREEERATVAREIHDDLGQTLTALKMDIAWMKKNSGMTEEMRVSKLDGILELTDSTIQTVKRIATDLRPGILDDLGLLSAIEWQTKEFQNRSSIECKFEIFVDEFTVEDDISIAVFRIFQESLTNIARHSQATKVTVSIRRADDFILVEISDNGVGINEEQINSSKSLGLLGMNERVSVFRGKLTISRAAEGGTAVRVYIPMGKT